MTLKKHKIEEIVAQLRQLDVLLSQNQSIAEAIHTIKVQLELALATRPQSFRRITS